MVLNPGVCSDEKRGRRDWAVKLLSLVLISSSCQAVAAGLTRLVGAGKALAGAGGGMVGSMTQIVDAAAEKGGYSTSRDATFVQVLDEIVTSLRQGGVPVPRIHLTLSSFICFSLLLQTPRRIPSLPPATAT